MARTEGIRAMAGNGFKVVSPSCGSVPRTRSPGKGTTNVRRKRTIGKKKKKNVRRKARNSSGSRNAKRKRSGAKIRTGKTGPENRNRNLRIRTGKRTGNKIPGRGPRSGARFRVP
jgi:hypothetical protein